MVDLRLLAVLQVRMRQDVVCGGSAQQLLGAAAAQAVLAAVRGPDSFGGAPQTPTFPAERTPGGAGSLTDGAARDHGVVLTETERENYNTVRLMLHKTASPDTAQVFLLDFCPAALFVVFFFFLFFFPFPFKST